MRFGLFYVLENRTGDHRRAYEEMLDQIEYGEELGFDHVWLAEHHSSNYGTIPRPAVALASIAERTEHIDIGTLISVLPFDDPVRVAEDYAMVDVLSGGRLQFGVGRGYQPSEFRNMGADINKSRDVFYEALDAILGLWTEESFSYQGEHVQVPEVSIRPKPVQDPHPPIYIASISSRTFEIVAERGYNCCAQSVLTPLDETKQQLAEVRQKLIDRGRPPEEITFPLNMQVSLSRDPDATREEIRENFEWYYHKLASLAPGAQGEEIPESYREFAEGEQIQDESRVIDRLIELKSVFLDPDRLIQELHDMQETFGLRDFVAWHRVGGIDDQRVRESMRIMAKDVMPEFQEDDAPVEASESQPVGE